MVSGFRSNISFDFRGAEVLLVEPSQHFTDLMSEILLGMGFNKLTRNSTPVPVRDGFDDRASVLVLIEPYPDCDGAMSFIRDLRRQDAEGPATLVIVVTGKPAVEMVEAARESGADYIVAKPFSPKVLLDRILWAADARPSAQAGTDGHAHRAAAR